MRWFKTGSNYPVYISIWIPDSLGFGSLILDSVFGNAHLWVLLKHIGLRGSQVLKHKNPKSKPNPWAPGSVALPGICSGEGCFGGWKQNQTILTQILIGLFSDWPKFRWSPKKKKKCFQWNWDRFSVQSKFFWLKSREVLDQFSSLIPLGWAIFVFVRKSASKVLKTGYFAYSSDQWGGARAPPPPPPAYATVKGLVNFTSIAMGALSEIDIAYSTSVVLQNGTGRLSQTATSIFMRALLWIVLNCIESNCIETIILNSWFCTVCFLCFSLIVWYVNFSKYL